MLSINYRVGRNQIATVRHEVDHPDENWNVITRRPTAPAVATIPSCWNWRGRSTTAPFNWNWDLKKRRGWRTGDVTTTVDHSTVEQVVVRQSVFIEEISVHVRKTYRWSIQYMIAFGKRWSIECTVLPIGWQSINYEIIRRVTKWPNASRSKLGPRWSICSTQFQ